MPLHGLFVIITCSNMHLIQLQLNFLITVIAMQQFSAAITLSLVCLETEKIARTSNKVEMQCNTFMIVKRQ